MKSLAGLAAAAFLLGVPASAVTQILLDEVRTEMDVHLDQGDVPAPASNSFPSTM